MSVPRFLTDEDIYAAVAPALRKIGLDAISTPERSDSASPTSHSSPMRPTKDACW